MPRPVLALATAVVLALTAGLVGCGDGGSESASCEDEVRERLDGNSGQHLLPGAQVPPYSTHPPTSGAHQLGAWPTGVLDESMPEPVQVALLEGGEVLVQHRGLAAQERRDLESLASRLSRVTVAPNPDLRDRVVATAWTFKQTCDGVETDELRRFVRAHAGKGA